MIKQRVIKLAVEFSTRALDRKPSFSLKVLEHILSIRLSEEPDLPTYSEAVRELQSVCSHELQRLALRYPDYFIVSATQHSMEACSGIDSLDGLWSVRVNDYRNNQLSFGGREAKSQLLRCTVHHNVRRSPSANKTPTLTDTIRHRSATVDQQLRGTRLESFLSPIKQSWDNPELRNTLSTFQGFTLLLGIERVQQYLINRKVHKLEDWSLVTLDDEGRALQSEMNAKFLASSSIS